MIVTLGTWVVKKGREEDFVRRWEESADSLSRDYPDLRFRLLRDRSDPRRFVSLGEGWRTLEQVEEVRSLPSFQDAMAAIWRLLESGEVSTLELAVEIS